jgi:hypothetical protein
MKTDSQNIYSREPVGFSVVEFRQKHKVCYITDNYKEFLQFFKILPIQSFFIHYTESLRINTL